MMMSSPYCNFFSPFLSDCVNLSLGMGFKMSYLYHDMQI